MKNIKLKSGEDVKMDIIYPTHSNHVDLQLTDEDCYSIFDAIDQNMIDQNGAKRKSTSHMVTNYGNLIGMNNPVINRIKDNFLEITDNNMIQKYGENEFKEHFKIHDILIYGTVMSSNTFDSNVRHNYPWDYSAVLFVKTPKNIKEGEGSLMFINRDVNTDNSEGQGVLPIEKHMVVFPSHLMVKDRSFKSETSEIRVTLNLNVSYVIKSFEEVQGSNGVQQMGKGISDEEFKKITSKSESKINNEW